MRILALSDAIDERLYGPHTRERFTNVDLVLSCGDLPYDYLDFVASSLDAPLYGVHGNHDAPLDDEDAVEHFSWTVADLHGRVIRRDGLLLGGLGGSRRYRKGPFQYSEAEMLAHIARMLPGLLLNRLRFGRFLDVFVTHAPPRDIHDASDPAHRGFVVFRWFLRAFRPRYHLHGHTHVYDARTVTATRFRGTLVLNVYGSREVELDVG